MKNNNIELKNVKGTFDYFSEELLIRNKIIDILKKDFELFGYFPLETPILCYYDLLSSKYAGGSEILKEVYTLKDQGNRELGLRYDLTIPFSKVIAMQKELNLPFKRYEIGKVFRDGPVKIGRNREFYQCDVDVCGIENLGVEVEFFQLTNKVFNDLNLNVEIHFNNRKFLIGLLNELGINNDLISEVIVIVDKFLKLEQNEVEKELIALKIDQKIVEKLFAMFNYDFNYFFDKYAQTTNLYLKEGLKELEEIICLITKLELKNCIFKPFLARGLEIYTGTVWEIFAKDGYRSSLGGGGRYDNIITKFINNNNNYPAVGMSFGLEPIYELIKVKNNDPKNPIDVFIYGFNFDYNILDLANKLRTLNFNVMVEMNNWKLKKTLDYANKMNIPYVIIIGEDEIKNNLFTIKELISGNQFSFSYEELIIFLEKSLKSLHEKI